MLLPKNTMTLMECSGTPSGVRVMTDSSWESVSFIALPAHRPVLEI